MNTYCKRHPETKYLGVTSGSCPFCQAEREELDKPKPFLERVKHFLKEMFG